MHDTTNKVRINLQLKAHPRFMWIKLLLLNSFLISSLEPLLSAHITTDHRCSHVPPTPEQMTYVWLDKANFSTSFGDNNELDSSNSNTIDESQNKNSNDKAANQSFSGREYGKSKRHIDSRKELLALESSVQSSMWNLLKRFEPPSPIDKDDLVPIKIQVYYDNSVYSLEKKKYESISELVMPTVVKFFENSLSIRRDFTIDRFRISRRCPNNTIYYAKDIIGLSRPYCMDRCEDYAVCGEMLVPPNHLSACSYCNSTSKRCLTDYSSEGEGVANAQLLLYVSAKQTSRCRRDQTIAYAAHCAQDAKTDRPVAGHANLCPSSISTSPTDLKALIATVKHELTHVLGFSVSLFAYFRDEHGQPLTERDSVPGPIPVDPKTGYAKWSDKVIKKIVRSDWVTGEGKVNRAVYVVVTPTVVKEVRNHFNCSTLEGAELEDQGSDGTSMTHWEKRIFENEAMTGTHTQNSVYSRITLAVLQDTGWYVANFSKAGKLEWGRNLGCDFARKSCKSWIDDRRAQNLSIRPFCDRVKGDLLQIACTDDRTSKAVCNMKQFQEPLPPAYQNFDQLEGVPSESLSSYGGSVDLADYCPFIQEFTWQVQNVTIRGSRCDLGSNNLEYNERNAALEYYGPQTKCFEHGRRWEQRSCVYRRHWHHFGAGCYKYNCVNGHINVIVGNYSYPCYYANQVVSIEQLVDQWLYNGTLLCPPCEKICPAHKCKSFDRRIVDKLISQDYDKTMVKYFKTDADVLKLATKEAIESLGGDSNSSETIKTFVKHRVTDSTNSIDDLKLNEHDKFKESILQIIASYEKPPRNFLQCSSTTSLRQFFHSYLFAGCNIATVLFQVWSNMPTRVA